MASIAMKLFLYFAEMGKDVNEVTIKKTWLPNATFRPTERPISSLEFELVIPKKE